eukprot:1593402-Rhodomonas_salina.2
MYCYCGGPIATMCPSLGTGSTPGNQVPRVQQLTRVHRFSLLSERLVYSGLAFVEIFQNLRHAQPTNRHALPIKLRTLTSLVLKRVITRLHVVRSGQIGTIRLPQRSVATA